MSQKVFNKQKHFVLYIEFQEPIPNTEWAVFKNMLWGKSITEIFNWSSYQVDFYKNRIIKDVRVITYFK